MKIMKLFFSATLLTMLFSSCLGDGDSTQTYSGSYGVVQTSSSGVKYAGTATSYGGQFVVSSAIDNLANGTAVSLSFTVNSGTQSVAIDGNYTAVKADNVVVTKITYTTGDYSPGAPINDGTVAVTSFTQPIYSPNQELFADYWMFSTNLSLYEEQKPYIHLYYDPNNQVDKDGKALENNQAIIDVRFTVSGDKLGTASNETKNVYVNLSNFRQAFLSKVVKDQSKNFTPVYIVFRYNRLTDNEVKTDYLGTFSKESTNNTYGLIYQNSVLGGASN